MKKLFTTLSILGALACASYLHAEDLIGNVNTDIATWQVGSSTEVALGLTRESRLYATNGIVNVREVIFRPAQASSNTFRAAGFTISTTNLIVQASTYYTVNITTMPYGRNIIVFSSYTNPGLADIGTTTLVGYATFYGVNMLGQVASEQIMFSTFMPAQAPATSSSSIGVGNIAWSHISSFTVQITTITRVFTLTTKSVVLWIGQGSKFGLSNKYNDPADIYAVSEEDLNVPMTAARANPTYNTVVFTNEPDSSKTYTVNYKAKASPPRR